MSFKKTLKKMEISIWEIVRRKKWPKGAAFASLKTCYVHK